MNPKIHPEIKENAWSEATTADSRPSTLDTGPRVERSDHR